MAHLYGYLTNDKIQQFDPHNDEAIAVDMFTPTLEAVLGLKGAAGGYKAFKEIKPFLGDIWAGKELLFHKPFNEMNSYELNKYNQKGLDYYQNYLQQNPIYKDNFGLIEFGRKNKGKDLTKDMGNYPFLRKNLSEAIEEISPTNTKNESDRVYHHLYKKNKNNLYDYIIEDIKDVGLRYKMMRNKSR